VPLLGPSEVLTAPHVRRAQLRSHGSSFPVVGRIAAGFYYLLAGKRLGYPPRARPFMYEGPLKPRAGTKRDKPLAQAAVGDRCPFDGVRVLDLGTGRRSRARNRTTLAEYGRGRHQGGQRLAPDCCARMAWMHGPLFPRRPPSGVSQHLVTGDGLDIVRVDPEFRHHVRTADRCHVRRRLIWDVIRQLNPDALLITAMTRARGAVKGRRGYGPTTRPPGANELSWPAFPASIGPSSTAQRLSDPCFVLLARSGQRSRRHSYWAVRAATECPASKSAADVAINNLLSPRCACSRKASSRSRRPRGIAPSDAHRGAYASRRGAVGL